MMKSEKIAKNIEKLKEKMLELQIQLEDLEKQKTQAENDEIVQTVRSIKVQPEELKYVLKAIQDMNVKAIIEKMKKEVISDEKE
ncbi:DUF4315 family protein [Clostridium sp. MD294]|uniref:DUF4315 family protein n=1 Tax=Clostridium sp. MD294 TaxID=97138 RepID=UPI0002C8D9F0|nr:DUF4315 family protein [Clostridium sp. MD294]NDO45255.1 DUF4315 family protein [Clostridium sp. MD294]USF31108.1 hypothetical protein C820_002554 [Clostridium sp. MD294]